MLFIKPLMKDYFVKFSIITHILSQLKMAVLKEDSAQQ